MKARKLLLSFGLALMLAPSIARAQLQLTITPNAQTANPGQTISWTIALKNLGANELFLNGASATIIGPGLTADETPFYSGPASLSGGATASFVGFTTSSMVWTPTGTYNGNFEIVGGDDDSTYDLLASQDFKLTIAPEGNSLALMLGGLAPVMGAFALRRRRLTK